MRRWIALALCAVAVGCGSRSYYQDHGRYDRHGRWDWAPSHRATPARDAAPPELALSDQEVAAALAQAEAPPLPTATPEPGAPAEVVAAEVSAAYRRGDRAHARGLVAAHPRVVDWSDRAVVVSCRYVGGWDGAIELTCIRADTSLVADRGTIAVCFEPGTFGEAVSEDPDEPRPVSGGVVGADGWNPPDSERRYRHWPRPQDLAFLRAPVVVIPAGHDLATARVPVACASFHRGAPGVGQPYALSRFPEGSPGDRLMQLLCQGEQAPSAAEAQLAVWMARDDISWADFVAEGGDRGRLVTFGQPRPVRARHAGGAARLLLRAGVDPRGLQFFGGVREAAPRDVAPAPEAPRTEPAPPVEAAPELPPAPQEPARHLS